MEAVIVTYNSERDLRSLVTSTDLLSIFSRVLVVDNASSDGTVEIAKAAGFETLVRAENDGFGVAANEGIRDTSGPVVALLNPDIHVSGAHTIEQLAAEVDSTGVGLVAPALELPDGRTQDSAREVPRPVDLLRRRLGDDIHGALLADSALDVPWVVGAFMVLRRDAFESVGGFDPRFHVYFEDVDLCVRLWAKGWAVRFVPTVRAGHRHNAASRKSLLSWSTRQHIRSALLFYRRHPRHVVRNGVKGCNRQPLDRLRRVCG